MQLLIWVIGDGISKEVIFYQNKRIQPGVVVHTAIPANVEAEKRGSRVQT
jgi:hypothetical protein